MSTFQNPFNDKLVPMKDCELVQRFGNGSYFLNYIVDSKGKKPAIRLLYKPPDPKPHYELIDSHDVTNGITYQEADNIAYNLDKHFQCGIGIIFKNIPIGCLDLDIKELTRRRDRAANRRERGRLVREIEHVQEGHFKLADEFDTLTTSSINDGLHVWFEVIDKELFRPYVKLADRHIEIFVRQNYVALFPPPGYPATRYDGRPIRIRQDMLIEKFPELLLSSNGHYSQTTAHDIPHPTGGDADHFRRSSAEMDESWNVEPRQSDEEVYRAAAGSRVHGQEFEDLYHERFAQQEADPDYSSKDQSLVNILAQHSDSKKQVARIWVNSPLGHRNTAPPERKDKTQLREDYVVRTVNRAFDKRREQYRTADQTPSSFNPFIFKFGSECTPQPVEWSWKNYLARRKLTLLAGETGTGKTQIALNMAATISIGGRWPDNSGKANPGYTLVYSIEDDTDDTLTPRFMANDGDRSKIIFLKGKRDKKGNPISFNPTTDFQLLLEYVRQYKGETGATIDLLIIDPIIVIVSGDANQNNKVRQALQTISDLAEQLNCAVIGIAHWAKGSQGRKVLERILHSTAFVQVARIVLNTVRVGNTEELWLVKSKVSNGVPGGGMSYCIEPATVKNAAGTPIETTRIRWNGMIEGNSDELIAKAEGTFISNGVNSDNTSGTKVGKAVALIVEKLKDGPCLQRKIVAEGEKQGISTTALQRAKDQLDIQSYRDFYQGPSIWDYRDRKK
jgi:putative DNA primase/helicase